MNEKPDLASGEDCAVEVEIRQSNIVILDDPYTDVPINREVMNQWYEEMRLHEDALMARILRGPEKPVVVKHGAPWWKVENA